MMVDSGVRSSWAALAENRFCMAKELWRRSIMALKDSYSRLTSVEEAGASKWTARSFSVIAAMLSLKPLSGARARRAAQ